MSDPTSTVEYTPPSSGEGGPHTHLISEVTTLQTVLNTKVETGHPHAISEVTNLQTTLDGKAASAHNHDASYAGIAHNHDLTYSGLGHNHDLSYSALGHNHTGVYEPANANIQAHVVSSHAPANAQKNSDITLAEIEAKLIGVISSHSHTGGSDPWSYVWLASDFTTSSNTAVDVTGLFFTPVANTRYDIMCSFLLRTNTATVGPRPGIAWPTGMTDGIATLWTTSSATAQTMVNGNISASLLAAVGGLPVTTASYPGYAEVVLIAGATPSGNFRIQLASETAGTIVTMKAGSFIKYRAYT